MGKVLVLIVLVVAAVWLLRRALRRGTQANERTDAAPKPQPASEELVRCVHCGLLLPRGEARQASGAIYCSEEHARLGDKAGPGR